VVAVQPPDIATMDLAEAPVIVAGGAGLDSSERFEQLAIVAAAIGAAMGATRVITDRGWLPHQRQIGTTGAVVGPRTYLAFGISGAVQHTSGLGSPDHIVSVNTDPHCPMMQLADLAIVADANAVVEALADRVVPA
jgi:electron transfer flavoprotein alpha subunit